MMGVFGYIFCLAMLHILVVSSITVTNITLQGNSNGYINGRSRSRYSLQCNFRTGYDDPVTKIIWYKDYHAVYEYEEGVSVASAYRDLSGHIRITGEKLRDLNFISPVPLDASGNYTCGVFGNNSETKSPKFSLVVLDVPSDDYVTNVTLLSSYENENNGTEDSNCTLLWDFKTPAIYPRPNVTCGYYSYLHDDVTSALPSGLTMQRLLNGSWIAYFDHTHIEISSIPRESRLGCAVSVPETSYKKVIKFEDNFMIDHLIDAEGCPSYFSEPEYRLMVMVNGGTMNCRGDIEQTSTDQPITVTFSCHASELAIFPNGSAFPYWSRTVSCDPRMKLWMDSSVQGTPPSQQRQLNNATDIPTCVPWSGSSSLGTLHIIPAMVLLSFGFTILH